MECLPIGCARSFPVGSDGGVVCSDIILISDWVDGYAVASVSDGLVFGHGVVGVGGV